MPSPAPLRAGLCGDRRHRGIGVRRKALELRQNIDESTSTTASGASSVLGGASKGKAIIILNPAHLPMFMRDTIFCSLPEDVDVDAVDDSVRRMVAEVATYVPGYRLRSDPQLDRMPDGTQRIAVFIEVEGAGDFLPPYAGEISTS